MRVFKDIVYRFFTLIIALQVLNISLNLSDSLLGKNGSCYAYVNEIETIVEFVAEVVLDNEMPETQSPGSSMGFEEEEDNFLESSIIYLKHEFVCNLLYKPFFYHPNDEFKDHIEDVTTPPPEIA